MASFNSVGGLASAVNNKVGALTSVAKGVMCLPSILTGLPGILGNVAKGVLGSLQNQALGVMNSIVAGITGMITDIINDAVNQISGVVNQLLQIQATILATIGIIEQTIKDLKKLVNDIINFLPEYFKIIKSNNLTLLSFECKKMTLDDLFLSMTGRSLED